MDQKTGSRTFRNTIESLYFSGFQMLAERHIKTAIAEKLGDDYPVWRPDGFEPPHLQKFNAVAWSIGVGTFAIMSASVSGGAVYLNWADWHARSTIIGSVGVVLCAVAFVTTSILLGVSTRQAWKELDHFLASGALPGN